jgi:hypothetical protein
MFGKITAIAALLLLPAFGDPISINDLGTQISGKEKLTQADLDKKLLVAHLWQAHCQVCETAVPAFEKEMRGKKSYTTPIILHSFDKEELAVSVADDLNLKIPVFHKPKKLPQFKMNGWPCVIIITPDGEVAYSGAPGKDFEKALRSAKKDLPK